MSVRTVVITGALSGIGEECSRLFANESYNVIISGRNRESGEELQSELRTINAESLFILADITQEDQVAFLFSQAQQLYGKIDVVLNVAGTDGQPVPIDQTTREDFHRVFATNVLGTQLVMKHVLPVMCQQRSGCLINFSSIAGQIGIKGGSIYSASKQAVNGMTRSAALEVAANGVRVNAIAPGPVDTAMFNRFVHNDNAIKAQFISKMPTLRIITTEEIASIALFLASDAARSIVGQIITVDGGYSVS